MKVSFNFPQINKFVAPNSKSQNIGSACFSSPVNFRGNLNRDVFECQKPDIYNQNPTNESMGIDESIFESKTMEKLYSPEFKPQKRFDEDGNPITTVIDKKTGEPVNVTVKQIPYSKHGVELWKLFVKGQDGKNEVIGEGFYQIDKFDKKIFTELMKADYGNKRYSGIGLRLHQIAVERMMQNNFDSVELKSMPQAFPFHYKSGFRVVRHKTTLRPYEVSNMITMWQKHSDLPRKELEKTIVARKNNDKVYFDSKSIENYWKLLYQKASPDLLCDDLEMSLKGANLKKWVERAKSQPIFLDE